MGNCNDGCGCGSKAHNINSDSHLPPSDLPTIRINGKVIDKQTLAQELQYHPAPSFSSAIQQAAQAIIIRMLLREAAEADNLSLSDEESAFETLLERHAVPKEITDTDCKRFYEQNPQSFTTAPYIYVRHILLSAKKEDLEWRAIQKKLATDLVEKLRSAEDLEECFNSLLTYSKCPSRENGGILGELVIGETVPEFERQVFALEEGLAPHPIETRFGYHIIWIQQKIAGQPVPYDAAKPKILSYLTERRARQAVADYLVTLVQKASIHGIELMLNSDNIVLPK